MILPGNGLGPLCLKPKVEDWNPVKALKLYLLSNVKLNQIVKIGHLAIFVPFNSMEEFEQSRRNFHLWLSIYLFHLIIKKFSFNLNRAFFKKKKNSYLLHFSIHGLYENIFQTLCFICLIVCLIVHYSIDFLLSVTGWVLPSVA